jgi:acyl-CoA thioester hydrolase
MADLGCSYAELEKRGFGLPVRRAELRFWKAAHYDEELVVRTTVGGMRAASITFEYEILREGGPRLASGTVELACVDLRSDERRPVPLPPELRAMLAGG